MKQIGDIAFDCIIEIYTDFVKDNLADDKWMNKDCKDGHDAIIVIKRINVLIEVGRELDTPFWKIIHDQLGKKRFEEIKAIHKKCRLEENKRGKK